MRLDPKDIRTRTTVVNIKHEPYDVYIGRAGHGQDGYFGNPFPLTGTRGSTLEKYKEYFHQRLANDPEFHSRVLALQGKRLGCFCDDQKKCHGGIIVEYLNSKL